MNIEPTLAKLPLSGKLEKYKISEAYIKLKLHYTEDNKIKIRKTLLEAAEIELKEFKYKDGLVYIVIVEKGSLKGKILIYGTLILQVIAHYGGIRQGLDQMWEDSRKASEYVINVAKENDDQINNDTIERTQKRTGLVGRIKRTLDRIDYLERNVNAIGNNQIREELGKLRQDLSNIIELLNEQDRQVIKETLSPDTTNNLPQPTDRGMQFIYKQYAIKPDDGDEKNE